MKTILYLALVMSVVMACTANVCPSVPPTSPELMALRRPPVKAPAPTSIPMLAVNKGSGPACAASNETCPAPDRSALGCCPASYRCGGSPNGAGCPVGRCCQ